MTAIVSRPLRPLSDAEDLIDLFETVFGYTVSPQMWQWKYLPPWVNRHYCWVGELEDRVVGYVGAVPLRGCVEGRQVPFFQLADAMVHPDYRLQHDYFGLAYEAILEDMRASHPEHLLYGFSNHRAFLWFLRTGQGGLIEKARTRYVRIEEGQAGERYKLRDWDWDAPEIDQVWRDLGGNIKVGLIRDAVYLRWRYGNHPIFRYRLLGVYREGRPHGFVVIGNDGAGKDGRPEEIPVVDLLMPEASIRPVLSELARHLDNPLMTWLPTRLAADPAFWQDKDSGTHVYHFVHDSVVDTDCLQKQLYYTMGDVDWW